MCPNEHTWAEFFASDALSPQDPLSEKHRVAFPQALRDRSAPWEGLHLFLAHLEMAILILIQQTALLPSPPRWSAELRAFGDRLKVHIASHLQAEWAAVAAASALEPAPAAGTAAPQVGEIAGKVWYILEGFSRFPDSGSPVDMSRPGKRRAASFQVLASCPKPASDQTLASLWSTLNSSTGFQQGIRDSNAQFIAWFRAIDRRFGLRPKPPRRRRLPATLPRPPLSEAPHVGDLPFWFEDAGDSSAVRLLSGSSAAACPFSGRSVGPVHSPDGCPFSSRSNPQASILLQGIFLGLLALVIGSLGIIGHHTVLQFL